MTTCSAGDIPPLIWRVSTIDITRLNVDLYINVKEPLTIESLDGTNLHNFKLSSYWRCIHNDLCKPRFAVFFFFCQFVLLWYQKTDQSLDFYWFRLVSLQLFALFWKGEDFLQTIIFLLPPEPWLEMLGVWETTSQKWQKHCFTTEKIETGRRHVMYRFFARVWPRVSQVQTRVTQIPHYSGRSTINT